MNFTNWPWRHWRRVHGDAVALRLPEGDTTWRQLCQQVDRLANGFHAAGLEPGNGVALRAKNRADTLLAWLALIQCGARVLPINPQLPDELLIKLLPGLSIDAGLALGDCAPLPGLKQLPWQEQDGHVDYHWQPERLVSMTLTSGSTGLPKAAVHTAAAHLSSAAGVLSLMPFTQGDSWLLSLPLFHVSGQGILWRWLLAGATLVIRPMHPLNDALAGCTHASLVPTQLWRLLAGGQEDHTLKAVLLGGAAIPVDLAQQAEAAAIRCWCGYGMTELASTVCAKRADGLPDVGQPLPGREVQIVENEIWIRAGSLASGYWRDGALQPLVNGLGWFTTRDRGEWRGDNLLVLGRLDNLFFSGGEGIQPEEVERAIASHPRVQQVMVVPVDDAEFGQRPVAVVECDGALEPDALAAWLSGRIARFQQPVAWFSMPETLKQGGIKISRKAVMNWVAAHFKAD